MKQTVAHCLILLAVASTIFFTSLGKAQLWDRDEPRNAGCAVEMMQRGDLIVPIFNDELRRQKPVLLYWLMMSAYAVFGVSEFSARFWSAVLGLGTVLLTYGIARRLFDPATALLSGMVLCSSLMFGVAARAATPDSALIFFSTLGLYVYIRGTFATRENPESVLQPKRPGLWFPAGTLIVILMNAAFALGVLTKGPVGIVLPTAIIGMFMLIMRRQPSAEALEPARGVLTRALMALWKTFNPPHFWNTICAMRPLTAMAVVMLIAAPWFVLVGIRTDGEFTRLFFLTENLARATTTMENHSGGWWYYPAAIAIGFFPWSVFLGPMLFAVDHGLTKQSPHRTAITFLVCWVAVQVGIFTLAQTKLPSYVTPCYPALAMLTSFCLLHWIPSLSTSRNTWQYAAFGTFVLAGFVTAIGLGVAAGKFFPEIWWIALIGLIPIVGGTLAIVSLMRQMPGRSLITMTAAAILFCLVFFGVGTVAIDSTRQTDAVLGEIRNAESGRMVACYRCLESSWVYYAGRPIHELLPGVGSAESNPTSETLLRQSFWQQKHQLHPEDFVAIDPQAMILTDDEHVDELLGRLPSGFQVAREAKFFLRDGRRLILVSRSDQNVAVADAQEGRERH